MNATHDTSYKRLFSCPEVVRDLLRGYVPEVSLLAEQLAKERPRNELPKGRLPPILPIVLYNGKPEWHESVNVADCFFEPPAGMDEFRPALKYLLLDERRLQQHPLAEVRNFADAVFRMEAVLIFMEYHSRSKTGRKLGVTPCV
jgi:hypothetical protein